MKILYIITQSEGGGAQSYVLALAKYFKGSIAAGRGSEYLFTEAAKNGIPTYSLRYLRRNINPLFDFFAVVELSMLICRLKPDLVHLNSTKAGILGSIAGKLCGTAVIFTAHGFHYHEPLSRLARWFSLISEKLMRPFRDRIIAVSEADRTSAITHSVMDASRIVTVHNGIGPIPFLEKHEARSKLSLPQQAFIIGSVGNFYKNKGYDVLIDAVAKLSGTARSRITYVIIGSGPEFENCKLKIENAGLTDSIILSGSLENAKVYLKAFDVFTLPSRKEGFSYILLEAMQAGLPIVATDVGGNKEALADAGLIVPPEHPEALQAAIARLASDVALRTSLAEKAEQRSKQFTESTMLEQTELVYKSL